jgi:hypothetical protein
MYTEFCPAVWNHRSDRGIDRPQILHAKDAQVAVDDTLTDVLAHAKRAAGICEMSSLVTHHPPRQESEKLTKPSLRPLQIHLIHGFIRVPRHGSRVILPNDILHPLTRHQQIVHLADALAHGDNVQLIRKEADVDLGLLQRIRRVQLHRAGLGQRPEQIDSDGEVLPLGRGGDVPLEWGGEHGNKVDFKIGAALRDRRG